MSWAERPARVRAPATSANLGPGFDALGLALALHDEVEAWVTDGGLVIEVSGEGGGTAAAGERHLVVRAMRAAFGAIGGQPPGIALRCANAIPHGRGLGSSAAAICSGVLAARALAGADGTRLSDEAVFQLAVTLEGHPDNVAACLAGGLTIAWTPRPGPTAPAGAGEPGARRSGAGEPGVGEPGAGESGAGESGAGRPGVREAGAGEPGSARLLRIGVPAALRAVACVPTVPLATEAARQALPRTVPHADAAANAARSALLIAAFTGAPHLLFDATEDFLHQPYRAAIMPETASLLGALRRAGAAAVVSGAGPTVLVLSFDGQWPSADAVDSIARETGIAWHVIPLHIDQQGAHVQQGGLDVHPPVSARHAPTWDQGPSWNQSEGRAQAAREGPGVTGPVSGVTDRQQPKECRGLRWC
ncbi:MAG TPA: homoserine kinase [Streptosporangiaceae bacterium]|nr:homoserine kinase [Streptosporangiaceae bacterium]